MDDRPVFKHIEALVEEEEQLYEHAQLSTADRERLQTVKVELDRCWDLLRRRRALREAGQDPEQATLRDATVVENYLQ
jgi:hypothetical protein